MEEQLVRAAQRGDRESRDALARAWLRRVYAVAIAITTHAADAEEASQNAFVQAFRALPRLRDPARFGPWMLRIARNAARDVLRRRRDEGRLAHDTDVSPPALGAGEAEEVLVAWRGLPADERLVVWLRVVDGCTLRDVAELLATSKSRVHRLHERGMARLRKEWARC